MGDFSLTPRFKDFCNGVLSMENCYVVFLRGWLKLGMTYVTVSMRSPPGVPRSDERGWSRLIVHFQVHSQD